MAHFTQSNQYKEHQHYIQGIFDKAKEQHEKRISEYKKEAELLQAIPQDITGADDIHDLKKKLKDWEY